MMTILFLALTIFLSMGLSFSKYQKNSWSYQENQEAEYFANELEQKLHIP